MKPIKVSPNTYKTFDQLTDSEKAIFEEGGNKGFWDGFNACVSVILTIFILVFVFWIIYKMNQ